MISRTAARARAVKPSSLPFLLTALASAIVPTVAYAQDSEAEPEIIVTAPIEGSRIESLQGAEVLRRDDIIEQLHGGLGDTLDSVPGIASTFFGAAASRPIIRGLGEDRVRILQNGIGAIDASTASPDHAVTSDGLDAERIEVLRGAAALAYGGNAIGGVVNVIDRSIPMRRIDGVTFDGLAAYSSGDSGAQGDANLGFGAGPFALRLSTSARDTDPYETPLGVALNQWTSARTYGIGGSFVGDWGYSGVAVKRTEDEYGLLPESALEPGGHIELEQTRLESRGDFQISIGPFDRLDYGVQHSDYQHTEFEGSGAPGTRFTSEGWEGRFEAHHGDGPLEGAIGVQISEVDFAATGDEAFIAPTTTQDSGVFVVERYDLETWGFEGGVRYERRDLENGAFGSRAFESVSTSVGLFVRPAPNWFAGATLARVERAPTAIELFADGPHLATANYEVGDATLDQEQATSFEASLRYNRGPARFELNLYGIDFADYIASVERGDVWWVDEDTSSSGFAADEASAPAGADQVLPVFATVQRDATFVGGEISAAFQLGEIHGFAITADGALDLVRANFVGGGHPPRIPPRSLTLGVRAESEHWMARLEAVDTAKQNNLAPFETATDGFTFINAGLAWCPTPNWTLRLDGRNLTDELGRVHSSFLKDELPLPGRSFRLTLQTSF